MSFECPAVPCQIHATCVAIGERSLLIVGHSGAGKSALALQLMAFGAELVADDRCALSDSPHGVLVRRPDGLPEAIEARGIGVLSAPCTGPTLLTAVLDLDHMTEERIPELRSTQIGSHEVRLLHGCAASHLPAALFHFLKHGFHGSMGT